MKMLKKVILTAMLTIVTLATMCVYSKATNVKITGETINIRKEPSTNSQILAMLSEGVECELIKEVDDWYQIKYKSYTGYISKQYAKIVEDTNNNNTQVNNTTENNNIVSNNTNSSSSNKETNNNINQATNTNENITNNEQVTNSQTVTSNPNDITSSEETGVVYKSFLKKTDIRILPLIYSSVIESAKIGEKVLIITEMSGWSYIQTNTVNGWVRSNVLGEVKENEETPPAEDDGNETEVQTKKMYIKETSVNLREGAGTSYNIIKTLTLNTEVVILKEEKEWYQVQVGENTGYVSKEFLSDKKSTTTRGNLSSRTENREDQEIVENSNEHEENTENQSNTQTETKKIEEEKKKTEISKESEKTNSTSGSEVISYAKKYLGSKYVYGGDGANGTFDCSGFTMYVYKHFGITLPHGATSQYQSGKGTKITKQNDLKTGDIVFLTDYSTGAGIGHCGIYIGDGEFIHASTTTYTVTTSNLNTMYKGRFYAGLRLL